MTHISAALVALVLACPCFGECQTVTDAQEPDSASAQQSIESDSPVAPVDLPDPLAEASRPLLKAVAQQVLSR